MLYLQHRWKRQFSSTEATPVTATIKSSLRYNSLPNKTKLGRGKIIYASVDILELMSNGDIKLFQLFIIEDGIKRNVTSR